MKQRDTKTGLFSRRIILKGATAFVLGGAAGYLGKAPAASAAGNADGKPPPLPWTWAKLDPLEAGRRAYRAYFEHKG
jgi:hypothetical protein